jgi:hypothetical protein
MVSSPYINLTHMKSMALADAGLRIGQVLSLGTVFMTGFSVAARVN